MCTRHDLEISFLTVFRDRLLDLPVARKASHGKFFRDSEDDFLLAKDMHKMFATLKRHRNYRNYEVLHEVVKRFSKPALQRRMKEYCKSLEAFEKETRIDIYLRAISAGVVLWKEISKMTMKMNRSTSTCTLYEIRKLKEDMTETASFVQHEQNTPCDAKRKKMGALDSCFGLVGPHQQRIPQLLSLAPRVYKG